MIRVVVLSLVAAMIFGCGGGRTKQGKSAKKKDVQADEAMSSELVETSVRSLVVGANPNDYAAARRQLDSYVESRPDAKTTFDAKVRDALSAMGWKDVAALEAAKFSVEDLDHIVDVQSLTPVAKKLRTDDDLATARATFAWVVRHVQLAPQSEAPAAGMYLTLLRGRGTVQARTWIFLEMLRIQGIDGAVVEDLGQVDGGLAAALIRRDAKHVDAYLFDSQSGVAVPNKTGDGVATLKEAMADPQLLALVGYKPSGSARPKLSPSLHLGSLSPRMAAIETALSTSELRLRLAFDLLRWRDAATTALSGDGALGLWAWPHLHRQAFAGPLRFAGWDSVNYYWRKEMESPLRALLMGDADAAAKSFIRFDFNKSVDQFALELRSPTMSSDVRARTAGLARQDVIYFGGLSQLERSDSNPAVAQAWFERYLKQYAAAEFGPESIVGASRLSLEVFRQGMEKIAGPGQSMWALADEKQRATMEFSARDAAGLASVTPGGAAEMDNEVDNLLRLVENLASQPQSEVDSQAKKKDPREQDIQIALKTVGDKLARSPSAFGENLLKRHVQGITQKVNNSLQMPAGIKEQSETVKLLTQRVGEARNAEQSRAVAARGVLVELLAKLEKKPDLVNSPDLANALGSLTGDELALLKSSGGDDARRVAAKRKLIAAAFGPELLMNPSTQAVWAPAALRNLAAARLLQGKKDAALETLKSQHPALLPMHRAELDVWARIVEKHAKWRPD